MMTDGSSVANVNCGSVIIAHKRLAVVRKMMMMMMIQNGHGHAVFASRRLQRTNKAMKMNDNLP